MANWAYIENNQIRELFDQLPKNWKNVSNLDALEHDKPALKKLGWYPMSHNRVDYNPDTQILESKNIMFDGNQVIEIYTVRDIEQQVLYDTFVEQLRNRRNKLLQESDYMCLPDIVQIKGKEWLVAISKYRQELRDITNLYKDQTKIYTLKKVKWPIIPDIKEYPKESL